MDTETRSDIETLETAHDVVLDHFSDDAYVLERLIAMAEELRTGQPEPERLELPVLENAAELQARVDREHRRRGAPW